MKYGAFVVILVWGTAFSLAQESAPPASEPGAIHNWNERILDTGRTLTATSAHAREDYQIGAEDLVEISVFEVPELSRTVRVSASEDISLPLIGTTKAAGLSSRQLEQVLTDRLRGSLPAGSPGLRFPKRIQKRPRFGGGRREDAGLVSHPDPEESDRSVGDGARVSEGPLRQPGRTIIITHSPTTRWVDRTGNAADDGSLNSAAAVGQPNGTQPESIEIPIKQLLESGDPQWNAPVFPGDVMRVVPAGTFYVAGTVVRPGGFPLTDFDKITVIQALAMAGGPTKSASLKNAVIIRRHCCPVNARPTSGN